MEEELGDMEGKKVLKELVGVPPHLGHLLQLLPGLLLPQEVQGRGNLHLNRNKKNSSKKRTSMARNSTKSEMKVSMNKFYKRNSFLCRK